MKRGQRMSDERKRVEVRMKNDLHEQLKREAKQRGISVNSVIVSRLYEMYSQIQINEKKGLANG